MFNIASAPVALVLGAALAVSTAAGAQDKAPITLEQTHRGSGERTLSLFPRLDRVRWAPDGVHLIRTSGGKSEWIDAESGEVVEPPADAAPDDADEKAREVSLVQRMTRAIPETADRDADAVERIAKALAVRPEQLSDDGEARMVYVNDELWFWREGSEPRMLLSGADGPIEYDRLSPDGAYVSYVRRNDFYLCNTSTGAIKGVTRSGGPDQFNGILDWVYQEEIYGRGNFLGHAWSPSSKHAIFLALDESPVHEFTVVDHIEEGHFRVEAEVTNYPKVGDPNPIPAVGIVPVKTARPTWVDLSAYGDQEILVVRFGWTPDGKKALVTIQDRIQTWAELLEVDPKTGETSVLIRETSKAWTERPEAPMWLEDGSFLWHSHRTGPMHLYHHAADGTLIRPVTRGDWNLQRVIRVDEGDGETPGSVLFQCTADGDINVNVYRVGLDGTGFKRLTQGDGSHSLTWNEDRTKFLDRWSSLTDPGEVRVCDADGRILHVLAEATVPGAETTELGSWELHEVTTRDGVVLDAALLKPADFDPSRSYAVWISTYSGPAAPSVRNRWNGSAFNQFLAQQGVLVLQANVRSSTNRGPEATAALYRRVGLQEVDDMCDVLDWLTANPWADASRVGITGYSFGGSMTANCLTRTDKFALGVAGGGVYDWRMYDTIYTERYMRTPEDNLQGYLDTSILASAKDLRGYLHMHHGIMDDNVHVQNMFQMAKALMDAGKMNWSMMAYPQTRHGIRDAAMGWHERRTTWRLIQEHLLGS